MNHEARHDAAPQLTTKPIPKLLWFLTLFYAAFIVLANWFNPWFVRLFDVDVNAGIVLFPLSYLLIDVVTEVYGILISVTYWWAC